MEIYEKLNEILAAQKAQIKALEDSIRILERTDTARENRELKKQSADYKDALDQLKMKFKTTDDDNKQLKQALFEQMYSQRNKLLDSSKKEMDVFFANHRSKAGNRLSEYEKEVKGKLAFLSGVLEKEVREDTETISKKIEELEVLLCDVLLKARRELEEETAAAKAAAEQGYKAFEEETLGPEQIQAKLKNNNVELKIGSRVANVAGVVLILLGVIFGLQYSYTHFLTSDELKGAAAFFFGLVFLCAGEYMNRKQRSVFSLGIASGGIAILFTATAISYFSFEILSLYPALGICVLVTVLAFFLSVRYNSQTISIFALMGGYLPMMALEGNFGLYSAMIYFLLLNVFALGIAARKNWRAVKYVSFVLNSFGVIVIFLSGWYELSVFVKLLYCMVNFLLYIAIVLIYPLLQKQAVRRSETILLGLNTFLNCLFIFFILQREGYEAFNGLAALIICVVYFFAGKTLDKYLTVDKQAAGLFYFTGFAFGVLVVPLQFDADYLSLGWLFQGVALAVYGILYSERWYKRCGFLVCGLCLWAFLAVDLPLADLVYLYRKEWLWEPLLVWKYSAITFGSLIILGANVYKHRNDSLYLLKLENWPARVYKYMTVLSLWLYILYMAYEFYFILGKNYELGKGWFYMLLTFLTFAYAYGIKKIPVVQDRGIGYISMGLSLWGIFSTIILGGYDYGIFYFVESEPTFHMVPLLFLIAYNGLVVLVFKDLLMDFVKNGKLSYEWCLLTVSVFSLVLGVELLIRQFGLGFNNMIISFVLIVSALGLIMAGFFGKFSYIRRFGLGLSLLALTKLFVLDLAFLESGQRILSYFVFGAVFIGISYVYQVFSRKFTAEFSIGTVRKSDADPSEVTDFPEGKISDETREGAKGDD